MVEDAVNENHLLSKSFVNEENNKSSKKRNRPRKPKNTKPFKTDKACKSRNKQPKKKKKSGVKALQEIKKYQRDVKNLIPKSAFKRLVQEIIKDVSLEVNRLNKQAIEAMQDVCEAYLVEVFQETQLLAIHKKKITIDTSDMQYALRKFQ